MRDYDKLSYYLGKYDIFSVSPCSCRASRRTLNDGCGHLEQDMCIQMGKGAEHYIRTGRGRQVSREEVLEILKRAEDNGLMEGGTLQLVDTPGHVDFSAETERALQVLDYAVVVVSGTAGVQGHTHTLWQLLRRRHIPAFVFVNKMDAAERSRGELLAALTGQLGGSFVDFTAPDRDEQLAVLQDELTERFLRDGELSREDVRDLIARREAFPCYFGSALKLDGVDELLRGLWDYTRMPRNVSPGLSSAA